MAGLLARAALDPLRQVQLSERELESGGQIPEVDVAELAVYVQAAYARYRDGLLLLWSIPYGLPSVRRAARSIFWRAGRTESPGA